MVCHSGQIFSRWNPEHYAVDRLEVDGAALLDEGDGETKYSPAQAQAVREKASVCIASDDPRLKGK